MKIGIQIFPACMQDVYKRIHASRVTYERLAHVHSPYVHIFQQYLQHTYVSIHVRWDVREALHDCKCTSFTTTLKYLSLRFPEASSDPKLHNFMLSEVLWDP